MPPTVTPGALPFATVKDYYAVKSTSGKLKPLTDIYDALGITDGDHVSICWKNGDGKMYAEIHTATTAPEFTHARNGDVYFGVNPVGLPVGSTNGKRGKESEVSRVVALYADLDVKEGACPDIATANQIIDDVSAILHERPVCVIASGGGLQPLWAVDDCDAATGRQLSRRFGRLVKRVAKDRKSNVDNVFDTSRVLRVPGTFNQKYTPAVEVKLLDDTGAPMTTEAVTASLDEVGIVEMADDVSVSRKVVSGTKAWQFGEKWCSYSKQAVAQWDSDSPRAGVIN